MKLSELAVGGRERYELQMRVLRVYAEMNWMAQERRSRVRRASMGELIKQAERNGKNVASVTRDGTTLHFGGADNAPRNADPGASEWDIAAAELRSKRVQ